MEVISIEESSTNNVNDNDLTVQSIEYSEQLKDERSEEEEDKKPKTRNKRNIITAPIRETANGAPRYRRDRNGRWRRIF